MGNYPDDVFCVNCGYQIYFDTDPLMISLLMYERNEKWRQFSEASHCGHGAKTKNSPEYTVAGFNARYNYLSDGSRTRFR